jgi:hypothetical protein
MVQRPESRRVEEQAVNLVERLFNEANWQVNRFYRDFGIDLHVKVFEGTGQQQDTPWEFYVQVKGTKRLRIRKGTVGFSIDVDHLRLWSEVSLPILLIICDVTANSAYWLGVKEYVRFLSAADPDWKTKRKSIMLDIPIANQLTEDALVTIRRYVQGEIMYTHAHRVVSVIRWWAMRHHELSYDVEPSDDLLPIDPSDFPELSFPDSEINKPVLAYCWGCGYIWWMDESATKYDFDEDEGGWYQWPPMYVGTLPEPDAYYVDPDYCPRCQSGEGRLDLCIECGQAFWPLEEGFSEEEWEEEWGQLVTFEEAKELCGNCFDKLLRNRKRRKR